MTKMQKLQSEQIDKHQRLQGMIGLVFNDVARNCLTSAVKAEGKGNELLARAFRFVAHVNFEKSLMADDVVMLSRKLRVEIEDGFPPEI